MGTVILLCSCPAAHCCTLELQTKVRESRRRPLLVVIVSAFIQEKAFVETLSVIVKSL